MEFWKTFWFKESEEIGEEGIIKFRWQRLVNIIYLIAFILLGILS